jgi:23S rRNA pseudouridine1911/1915/1917 synthase
MDHQAESFSFKVSPEDAGVRIDRYLTSHFPETSRTQIQRAAKAGELLVDGSAVKVSYKVRGGDQIEVRLTRPEDPKQAPRAEDIALDVVYEDEAIIVINKPAGMVVHPAVGHRSGTLVNALLGRGVFSSIPGAADRPGIVHRLDKGTSGLLVCARTESAHRKLAEQLKDRSMSRTYLAVIWGHFKADTMTFDGPIGRSSRDRKRMAVTQSGRPAITTAVVQERFALVDLLEVTLESGRTHQIRVHLSHAGHPIVGDTDYGGGAARLRGIDHTRRLLGKQMLKTIGRPALHAARLKLVHPVSLQELSFTAEPPEDFHDLIEQCREMV